MATKTKKIIRNLHQVPVNLRFGSRKDPYYLTLSRRGSDGDWVEVPGDIADHPDFNRNVGNTFEIISAAEAKKIQYESRAMKTAIESDAQFKLERMSDTSTTIALVDADPKRGGIIRTGDANPMRSRATGTVDNPAANERPGEAAEAGDAPPVSPELPAFGGVDRSATKARATVKKTTK